MAARQASGLMTHIPVMQELSDQYADDILLAEQNALQYQQQLQDSVAQQANDLNAIVQAQQEANEARHLAAQQAAQQATVQPTVGLDPELQEFVRRTEDPKYQRNGATFMNGLSTMWARDTMDKVLNEWGNEQAWTDQKRAQVRRKIEKAYGSKVQEKDTNLLQDIGDLVNDAVEGFGFGLIGGSIQLGAAMGNIAAQKMGFTDNHELARDTIQTIDAWRDRWRSLASDKQLDQELGMEQAKGAIETIRFLTSNPGYLAGASANMVGSGINPARLLSSTARAGAKTLSIGKSLFGSGAAKTAASQIGKAADDVMLARSASWLSPTSFVISEATDAGVGVLRNPNAYNQETQRYSDDAALTAGAGALLAGGITAAGIRMGGTAEGVLSRFSMGTRGDLAGKSYAEAINRVGTLMGASAPSAQVAKAIADATVHLTSHAGRKLLTDTASTTARRSMLGGLLSGTGTIAKGMAWEGMEEAMIGLVSSAAYQGIGADGKFSVNNIDGEKLWNDIAKSAVLGAALGGVMSPLRIASDYQQKESIKQDYLNLKRTLDWQTNQYKADLQTVRDLEAVRERQRQTSESALLANLNVSPVWDNSPLTREYQAGNFDAPVSPAMADELVRMSPRFTDWGATVREQATNEAAANVEAVINDRIAQGITTADPLATPTNPTNPASTTDPLAAPTSATPTATERAYNPIWSGEIDEDALRAYEKQQQLERTQRSLDETRRQIEQSERELGIVDALTAARERAISAAAANVEALIAEREAAQQAATLTDGLTLTAEPVMPQDVPQEAVPQEAVPQVGDPLMDTTQPTTQQATPELPGLRYSNVIADVTDGTGDGVMLRQVIADSGVVPAKRVEDTADYIETSSALEQAAYVIASQSEMLKTEPQEYVDSIIGQVTEQYMQLLDRLNDARMVTAARYADAFMEYFYNAQQVAAPAPLLTRTLSGYEASDAPTRNNVVVNQKKFRTPSSLFTGTNRFVESAVQELNGLRNDPILIRYIVSAARPEFTLEETNAAQQVLEQRIYRDELDAIVAREQDSPIYGTTAEAELRAMQTVQDEAWANTIDIMESYQPFIETVRAVPAENFVKPDRKAMGKQGTKEREAATKAAKKLAPTRLGDSQAEATARTSEAMREHSGVVESASDARAPTLAELLPELLPALPPPNAVAALPAPMAQVESQMVNAPLAQPLALPAPNAPALPYTERELAFTPDVSPEDESNGVLQNMPFEERIDGVAFLRALQDGLMAHRSRISKTTIGVFDSIKAVYDLSGLQLPEVIITEDFANPNVRGQYRTRSADPNSIGMLRLRRDTKPKTIAHEYIHALTINGLFRIRERSNQGDEQSMTFIRIMNKTLNVMQQNAIGRHYGNANVYEMFAEMTNPDYMEQAATISADTIGLTADEKSLLRSIDNTSYRTVRDVIARLIRFTLGVVTLGYFNNTMPSYQSGASVANVLADLTAYAIGNHGTLDADARFDTEPDVTVWDTFSSREQRNEILLQTQNRYTAWVRAAFGQDVLDRVVFVAPETATEPTANGYTLDSDPNHIYMVLHAGRTQDSVVWTIAHEMFHNGMTVRFRDRTVVKPNDLQAVLDPVMAHPYVSKLMTAMSQKLPPMSRYRLAEEALAEISAAQLTKNPNRIAERWGRDMVLPASLRNTKRDNVVQRALNWLKSLVGKLMGRTYPATDRQLNHFLQQVRNFSVESRAMQTPQQVAQYRESARFASAYQRNQDLHALARQAAPTFDSMDEYMQDALLRDLAETNGDPIAIREMRHQFRYDIDMSGIDPANLTPEQLRRIAAKINPPPAPKESEMLGAAAKAPTEANPQNPQQGVKQTLHAMAQSIQVYPARKGLSAYDSTALDTPVGLIAFVGHDAMVQVRLLDTPQGDITKEFTLGKDGDTADQVLNTARRWVLTTYPNQYTMRVGTAIPTQLYLGNNAQALTISEMAIMRRADRMAMDMPQLYKIRSHLQRHLPESWIAVLDKIMDFLHAMEVRWVNRDAVGYSLVNEYNRLTGNNLNVMEQLRTQGAEADAWLARRTSYYGDTNPMNTPKQSYKDRIDMVYDAIVASDLGLKQVERGLYAIEEMVRYPELLRRDGVDDGTGNKVLLDPMDEQPRTTVTGFRFADWETTELKQGQEDLGAARWVAALKAQPLEVRNALGRVVAEVAATNRSVLAMQLEHGTINDAVYKQRVERGRSEIDAVFPELAQQGVNFSGFFMSMQDDTSDPYYSTAPHGRTGPVANPLNKTQDVWRAEVRRAFSNKEMVNLVRIVAAMPNRHLVVEPVVPVFDGTSEDISYQSTTKDALASVDVIVDGVPVTLVAKTKEAAAMIKNAKAHEAFTKLGMINHFFNATKTTYNLAYIPIGLLRDMMTGYMNVSGAIGEQYVNAQQAPQVGFNTLKYALTSMPNLFTSSITDKGHNAWLSVYQQRGAGMFFGDQFNSGAFRGEEVNLWSHNPLIQKTSRVAQAVGYTPETAVRLGSFRAYTEHLFPELARSNVTADDINAVFNNADNQAKVAAIIQATKHITSNFQQHGSDNVVRYLFSFHNAVMQGTFDTLPRIMRTEHGRKTMGILMMATIIAAVVGIGGEDEDEFGNSKYFHTAQRHRRICLGDTCIPVPDEAALYRSFMENLVGLVMGKRNLVDAMVDVSGAGADMLSANEMGASGNLAADLMYGAMPTLTHGFIALGTGHDIFGNPLKREYLYDDKGKLIKNAADVERTTDRASETGRDLAEFLYGSSGGSLDMSGDEVDAFLRSYLGGVYSAFARSQTAAMRNQDGVNVVEGIGSLMSEPTRGFQRVQINKRTEQSWEDLKTRLGVSIRNAQSPLDVMGLMDDQVREVQTIIKRTEGAMKAARSSSGYTMKYLYDQRERAETEQRWNDVRDINDELKTVHDAREQLKADAIEELRILGVI